MYPAPFPFPPEENVSGPFSLFLYNPLCVPSQNGMVLLCLQPHNQTFFVSVISNSTGVKSLPLWEPSQNGWSFDLPQRHHQ